MHWSFANFTLFTSFPRIWNVFHRSRNQVGKNRVSGQQKQRLVVVVVIIGQSTAMKREINASAYVIKLIQTEIKLCTAPYFLSAWMYA